LTLVLFTVTAKAKVPPGSGRLEGTADFSTVILGGTLLMATTASSRADIWSPDLGSTTVATAVSVCVWPPSPVKTPGNEQV